MARCKFCFHWISSKFLEHESVCRVKQGAACRSCKEWFSKKYIETHESLCQVADLTKEQNSTARMLLSGTQCKFCFDWIAFNFVEHVSMCRQKLGALCKFCDQWFAKKHIETHENYCKVAQLTKEQCDFCKQWFGKGSGLTRHKRSCTGVEMTRVSQNANNNTSDVKQCWICEQFFMSNEIINHERACQKTKQNALFVSYKRSVQHGEQHQEKRFRSRREGTSTSPAVNVNKNEPQNLSKGGIIKTKPERHAGSSEAFQKCIFCNEKISQSLIKIHEESCATVKMYQREKCQYCGQWILCSGGYFEEHKRTCHARKNTVPCKHCAWMASESEIKLHEPKCNARKCRHCSSSISKHCLNYHEYICAYKEEHRNGKILQQCPKCHRSFTQEQFKQHTCRYYTDLQSQTDSVPNHSVSDTGVVVISPIAASDVYEMETNTEAETFIHALNKELPRAETNEKSVFRFKAEINTEPSMDEILKEEIKDTFSLKTGNIVEIKPKYEPEFTQVQTVQLAGPETGIIESCNSETLNNVLVIKPENDSATPELCKDVYFPNIKCESETGGVNSGAGNVTEAMMDHTESDNKSNISDFLVKSEPENDDADVPATDVIKSEDNQCIPDLHGEKDNSLRSLEHERLMYNQGKPHSFTLDIKQSNLRRLLSFPLPQADNFLF